MNHFDVPKFPGLEEQLHRLNFWKALSQYSLKPRTFQVSALPIPFPISRGEVGDHVCSCQVGQLSRILGQWEVHVGKERVPLGHWTQKMKQKVVLNGGKAQAFWPLAEFMLSSL